MLAPLCGKYLFFRTRAARGQVLAWIPLVACGVDDGWSDPPLATSPRFQSVQASVDQDAREPDLEGQFFPERAQVHVRFDERVLHRFVGVRGVAQIVKRNARRTPLMPRDEFGKSLASRVEPAGSLQRLHVYGDAGVGFACGHGRVGRSS